MPSIRQNIHTLPVEPGKISILLVTPHSDDLSCLRRILPQQDWHITHCSTRDEASSQMKQGQHCIIVCERDLADGTWKDVLEETGLLPGRPPVLVVSRQADECLWAEVLNMGGYDVLLKPFDHLEVTRVCAMAWRSWIAAMRNAVKGAAPMEALFA